MINLSHIHDMMEDGIVHADLIKDLKENKNDTYLKPIFFTACTIGDLELVKYCLTSTDLSSLEKRNEIMMKAFSSALDNNRFNIVSYFIFDLNMPYNGIIEAAINDYEIIGSLLNMINKKNSGRASAIPVRNMFKVRDEHQALEKELLINQQQFHIKNKL